VNLVNLQYIRFPGEFAAVATENQRKFSKPHYHTHTIDVISMLINPLETEDGLGKDEKKE
jgi:hypothetical protein